MKKTLLSLLLCACGTGLNVAAPPQEPPAPDKHYGSVPGPLTSVCELDPSSQRGVLVASTDTEAFLVRADGTRVTLATVGAQTWIGAPVVRGEFIALAISELRDNQYLTRVDLFDSAGQRLASAEAAGQAFLSEQGIAASWSQTQGLVLLHPDGSVISTPGLTPAGPFGPGTVLPVRKADHALALFDVSNGQLSDLAIPNTGWSAPIWAGDAFVYIGELDGQSMLVQARGNQSFTTPIPSNDNFGGIAVEQIVGDTAVLVSGSWVQVRERLDLKTGVLSPMEVVLPVGLTFAGRHSASLADDGSLVAALTQNGAAGMFRSLDGKSWTSMGGLVSGATYVTFAGRQGTWLVSAYANLGGLTTLGLVPAMGLTQKLPNGNGTPEAETISSDGRCAALWSGEGASFTLSATDLLRGTQRVIAEARQPGSAVWLH